MSDDIYAAIVHGESIRLYYIMFKRQGKYLCWGSGGGPLQYTNTFVSLPLCIQPSPEESMTHFRL